MSRTIAAMDSVAEDTKPLFSVATYPGGKATGFQDVREVAAWLDEQRSAWQKPMDSVQQVAALREILREMNGRLSEARKAVQAALAAENDGNLPVTHKREVTKVLRAFHKGELLDKDGPTGSAVLDAFQSGTPVIGCGMLLALTGRPLNLRDYSNQHVRDILVGYGAVPSLTLPMKHDVAAAKRGLHDAQRALDRQLEEMKRQHSAEMAAIQNALDAFEKEKAESLDAHQTALQEGKDRVEQALNNLGHREAAAADKHREAVERHKSEYEDIRRSYDREMQLRGPISYWAEMRKHHDTKASRARWIFFGWGAFGCIAIALLTWLLVSQGLINREKIDAASLVLLGLPVVFVIMLLRQSFRAITSHEFLANDARERVALVQTFKALERGELTDETERHIILNALFRPAAVPGDDGASTPIEALAKIVGSGGGKPSA